MAYQVSVNGRKVLKVREGASLLIGLREQGVYLPSSCGGNAGCGVCKCQVFEGGGEIQETEQPFLSKEDRSQHVRLSCQVPVVRDMAIQVPDEFLEADSFPATVEKIETLTHDIKNFRFRLDAGARLPFKAGQYAGLVIPPYGHTKVPTARAYSISSGPCDNTMVELIIRLVPNGMLTTYAFSHLKEGMRVNIDGPYGDAFLRDSDRDIICIAGGTGLAMIRSLVFDLICRGITHRKTTFFFGTGRLQDTFYIEEFRKLEKEHPWFTFVPVISKETADHPYEKGNILDVVGRFFPSAANHEAYLCGSMGMMKAGVKLLTERGMRESLVHYDKF